MLGDFAFLFLQGPLHGFDKIGATGGQSAAGAATAPGPGAARLAVDGAGSSLRRAGPHGRAGDVAGGAEFGGEMNTWPTDEHGSKPHG